MNNSIDQQFVEYIVKSLVSNPDAVTIERRIDEKGVLLELTVDPEDLGRVIGKRGATAQSLRTLLRALGTKNDARYNLKIVDNGEGPDRSERRASSSEEDSAVPAVDDTADSESQAASNSNDDAASSDDSDSEDVLSKTRKELNDLDDLDI